MMSRLKEDKMEDVMLQCRDCRWIGKDSECIRRYKGYTDRLGFDVEPVLECPKCNSENLWEIGTDKAELEQVPA
jgi:Zn finger protein HypA/HybF involved in hydrogenase expression